MMKWLAIAGIGIIFALLGLLWFLQGTGIVYLPPILCFANCEPITEPSLLWAIVGAIAFILGIFLVRTGIRRKIR
jgi:hypothetical protein